MGGTTKLEADRTAYHPTSEEHLEETRRTELIWRCFTHLYAGTAKSEYILGVVGGAFSFESVPPISSGARYRDVPVDTEVICPEDRPSRIHDNPKSHNCAYPRSFMRTFSLFNDP